MAEEAMPAEAPKEGEENKEEAPVEPTKEPEQQFEIKKRSKKNFGNLKFTSQSYALSPETRTIFKNLEN